MTENTNQNKGIESGRDAGEPEIKKEGIKLRSNAREPETKQRDQIRVRCLRIGNKTKGSNLSAMQENPKRNERIKSGRNAGETDTKGRD